MKRLLMGVGCLLLAVAACAAGSPVSERMEASVLVQGTLGVTAEGKVLGYSLDHPEKLPPPVVAIARNVSNWTFNPVRVDGKAVAAKARMHLRVVASPADDGSYRVAIRSAYFGDQSETVKRRSKGTPPEYPRPAAQRRIEGTVYLLLRLDREGNVADALAQQVNLSVGGSERLLAQWREVFAQSALKAAHTWVYSAAAPCEPDYRVLRTPVVYQLNNLNGPERHPYRQWEGYMPGPVTVAPWFDNDRMLSGGADALPGDGVYGPSSLSLLTPLDRS